MKVTFRDDTSHRSSKTGYAFGESYEIAKFNQSAGKTAKGTVNSSSISKLIHNSFLDGISYDVRIETQGPTSLRFLFNTQTSEELFADLQGRLYFNRTPVMSRLTGQVEVGNLSYYNFIKKFEATGKLLFTGNVLNPELEVNATYQGTHQGIQDTTNTQLQSTGKVAGTSKAPQVLVTLKITGTRNEPKIKVLLQTKSYSDNDWTAWTEGDDEANAMAYIIAGQFQVEMTEQQRVGLGANLGSAFASGMATGLISDLLRRSTSRLYSVCGCCLCRRAI